MTHLYLWPLSHDFVACRHFHDDTSWKSLKKHLTWRTHILSYVTPFDLIFAPLERYFCELKLSRRHLSLKMPRNTLKMSFWCVRDFPSRKPTYVRELLYIIVTYALNTRLSALQPTCTPRVRDCFFCNPRTSPENIKKIRILKLG